MKDSRIGTYGTVALFGALALKLALLVEVEPVWAVLLVAPALARLAPLFLMALMPYVTDTDASKTKPVADTFSGQRLGGDVVFGASGGRWELVAARVDDGVRGSDGNRGCFVGHAASAHARWLYRGCARGQCGFTELALLTALVAL